jgi:peptidoglycan/xylan/chitin deacetylase (PgdA/CDA1 family)
MPEFLKVMVRAPLAWLLNAASRLMGRRAGLIVVYHRVGDPHEDPAARLMPKLGTDAFEAQIRHLARRYRVVPLAQIVTAANARRRWERFPVAITFDDDSPLHAGVALPILKRLRAPATFFLSGASLERPFAFWYDRLQLAYDRGLVPDAEPIPGLPEPLARSQPTAIHATAEAIKQLEPDEYDRVAEQLLKRLGSDPADSAMPAADVRALVDAGLEIGFHTRRHYILPRLDDRPLAAAMEEGRSELAAVVGSKLTMIAYPNGNADDRVGRAARSAGFELGVTTDPRPVLPGDDQMLIGRVDATHDRSLGRFAFRIARVLRG